MEKIKMSGQNDLVSLQLNEQIEPIEIAVSEPMSVRAFMKHANEQLKAQVDSEGVTSRPAHEDYSIFSSVWESLKNDSRKPLVNALQTRFGYPRALIGGEVLSFQGKGDNGL